VVRDEGWGGTSFRWPSKIWIGVSPSYTDVPGTHAHPFQGPTKDPRTGEDIRCTSCHSPHSSTEETLLTHGKKRELCVQCHLGPNLEVRGRHQGAQGGRKSGG
jgi:predicted CXXCH cytochrome family protein